MIRHAPIHTHIYIYIYVYHTRNLIFIEWYGDYTQVFCKNDESMCIYIIQDSLLNSGFVENAWLKSYKDFKFEMYWRKIRY